MARPARKQPEIFNFSFLDILACTVGALTFILVLLIATTLNEVTSDADVAEVLAQIAEARQQIDQTSADNERLRDTVSQLARQEQETTEAIAKSKAELTDARSRRDEAKARHEEAKSQIAASRQNLDALEDQLAKVSGRLQELAPRVKALSSEVTRMQADTDQRARDLEQLAKEELNREELLARLEELKAENIRLPDDIQQRETEVAEARQQLESLAPQANEAARLEPGLLGDVRPRRKQAEELQAALASLQAQLDQVDQGRSTQFRNNRLTWTLVIVLIIAGIALVAYLLWRLWKMFKHAAPLKRSARQLEEARQKREKAEAQVHQFQGASEDVPESVDEALEMTRDKIQKAQQQVTTGRAAEARARAEAQKLSGEIAREEQEVSALEASAQREIEEARRRAAPVNFRVPLLRETSKDSVVFECFRDRAARVTDGESLDESNYELDLVKSTMVTQQVGQPVAILERKGNGRPASELSGSASQLGRQVGQLNGRRQFLFAIVRENGFDSFRRLRDCAWQKNVDVGWQPLDEEIPIMSGGGEGNGPGVQ